MENEQFVRKSSLNWRNPGIPFTPSGSDNSDDAPVLQVTWNDAGEFCRWLSDFEQAIPSEKRTAALIPVAYSLPSEAQWEYACRAGTETTFWYGDLEAKGTDEAVLPGGNVNALSVVARKRPNPFGLYDMHGNAAEWCFDCLIHDCYKTSPAVDPVASPINTGRVVRGGAIFNSPLLGRSASRGGAWLDVPTYSITFRVIRKLTGLTASRANGLNPAPPPAKAPFDAQQARAHQEARAKHLGTTVETTNSVGAKMILIPPGEFLMGSSDEQVAAAVKGAEELQVDRGVIDRIQKSERPQHQVSITKPFLMSATEVTIGQFKKFSATGYQTRSEKGNKDGQARTYLNVVEMATDDLPAAFVTWDDAAAFCHWLSIEAKLDPCYRWDGNYWIEIPGKNGYRLPTEAEWEYACRAGTPTQYSFGDDGSDLKRYGWYAENVGGQVRAAGTKRSNAFGLFDMHGNLWEWCSDIYDDEWYEESPTNDPRGPVTGMSRVQRGGSLQLSASECRSAYRGHGAHFAAHDTVGFRIVRALDTSVAPQRKTP